MLSLQSLQRTHSFIDTLNFMIINWFIYSFIYMKSWRIVDLLAIFFFSCSLRVEFLSKVTEWRGSYQLGFDELLMKKIRIRRAQLAFYLSHQRCTEKVRVAHRRLDIDWSVWFKSQAQFFNAIFKVFQSVWWLTSKAIFLSVSMCLMIDI